MVPICNSPRWIMLAAVLIAFPTAACGAQSTGGRPTPPTTPAVAPPAVTTPAVGTPTVETPPTVTLAIAPTTLPIEQVLSGAMPLTGQPLDYDGIVPGKSTRADVVSRRGPPNVIRRYRDFESLHYFTNGKEYFLLKDGIVHAVTSDRLGGYWVSDDLQKKFPAAAALTPNFGPPTWALPASGLAFSLYDYQFLSPMTLDEYITLWGQYPMDIDPFPLIPSVEAVGIAPGRTTRGEVESLLGPPDQKVIQDKNAPWTYDVEPDLLGRLEIFFDDRDNVQNMSIAASMRKQRYTLEDTVNQYGDPDWVQLLPAWEPGGEATQALLYLHRGLRVGGQCYPPGCAVVGHDTPVVQKWYFQPTTIDNYRKEFARSQFVPWHGFDK